jgi:hypothetical protein
MNPFESDAAAAPLILGGFPWVFGIIVLFCLLAGSYVSHHICIQ